MGLFHRGKKNNDDEPDSVQTNSFSDIMNGLQYAVNCAQDTLQNHQIQNLTRLFEGTNANNANTFQSKKIMVGDKTIDIPLIALISHHYLAMDNVKEDNRLLGDLSLCSRPHFAALRLLYLTLQATVQVAYLIINIIELQFSPCTFLLPARGIFHSVSGDFSRHDTPFTNHFLSSFCLFFVGFPCFLLRKCIAIPLFHYATFCFRISDLLNISVSGNSSKTVRLVIVVCT